MLEGEPPVVRGRHMKSLVEALEAWEGGARPLALLPADVLAAIADASGLDWLPLSLDLQVTQAVYDGLGTAEADRFFREHMAGAFDGPILQTLVATAVRLFGLDPASFARWVPRAWQLIFREVGQWRVEGLAPGATSATLTLARLPAECADHLIWHRSVSRSMSALFDLARVSGTVEAAPPARGGEVRFALRWTPRHDAIQPPAA
jgi:hypothetical protein